MCQPGKETRDIFSRGERNPGQPWQGFRCSTSRSAVFRVNIPQAGNAWAVRRWNTELAILLGELSVSHSSLP